MRQMINLADIPQIDFRLYRGDTAEIDFAVVDLDGKPFDFTQCEVLMQLRSSVGKPLAEYEIGRGLTAENGKLILHWTGSSDATWRTAEYDVEIKDAQDNHYTLWRGRIELVMDVTRAE